MISLSVWDLFCTDRISPGADKIQFKRKNQKAGDV
jgi:hypothetical protein